MRQYRTYHYRHINSLSKSFYNKMVQEEGPLTLAFAKIRESTVIQSFVVEWQMQINDLKKFNEKLVKVRGDGF